MADEPEFRKVILMISTPDDEPDQPPFKISGRLIRLREIGDEDRTLLFDIEGLYLDVPE